MRSVARYRDAVSSSPFISYAQNREDVVLYRALGHLANGRYVEVGANDPIADSVTYAFYKRDWSGITVEPVPAFAERLREMRPRDRVVEAAITAAEVDRLTLHEIAETGLSTVVDEVGHQHSAAGWDVRDVVVAAKRLDDVLEEAGWAGMDIHLLLVDTEGSEKSVLESVDLSRWRPWVTVVEATRPNSTDQTHESWEEIVLSAGYRFCLFDGLSRFYVADEHWDDLHTALSTPANVLDAYKPYRQLLAEREINRLGAVAAELTTERDRVIEDAARREREYISAVLDWRATAVKAWSESVGNARSREMDQLHEQIGLHINHIRFADAELDLARSELDAIRNTLSWRVTKPLRRARSLSRRPAS